jgi:hypothetical protein
MAKMKKVFLLAVLVLAAALCLASPAFAQGETTPTAAFDPSFLIEMGLVFGGIGTLAFVIAELIGMYVTKSATTSIVQTTSTAINAIVAMTGVGVTANQAAAVTEISGVPTQIPTSKPESTK